MRHTPLVGRRVWFGPRRFGWGWDPVWWQGWVAMAAWIALMFASALLPRPMQVPGAVGAVVGLLITCVLKGTSPGGPEAAERFREMRRHAKRTPEQIEADRVRRRRTEDEPSMTEAAKRLRDLPSSPERPG